MSTMFVIALDVDGADAEKFLRSIQEHKLVGYRTEQKTGTHMIRKLPVMFIYKTTNEGKCARHQR